jgi:small subunit ribosomal protein S16
VSVKLRLKRLGRSHRNFFRLSVMDTRTARDGRVIEELGWYDPGAPAEDKRVSLNRERIEFWLGNGALPSPTVSELLEKNGIASPKAK